MAAGAIGPCEGRPDGSRTMPDDTRARVGRRISGPPGPSCALGPRRMPRSRLPHRPRIRGLGVDDLRCLPPDAGSSRSSARPTTWSGSCSSSRATRACAPATPTSARSGSRSSVFDGPPAPVVLVEPGLAVEVVAETDALVAHRRGSWGTGQAHRAHRVGRDPRRGAWIWQHRAANPSHAAAGRRGGSPHRLRGLYARRELVELPAAQARHRGPAEGGQARGAVLLPVREAPGLRLRTRLHAGPSDRSAR